MCVLCFSALHVLCASYVSGASLLCPMCVCVVACYVVCYVYVLFFGVLSCRYPCVCGIPLFSSCARVLGVCVFVYAAVLGVACVIVPRCLCSDVSLCSAYVV